MLPNKIKPEHRSLGFCQSRIDSKILSREFFARPVASVARGLLGKRLVSTIDDKLTGGIIVETEAYLPHHDTASHAALGETSKNQSMFGNPGLAYVYAIHARWCFNTVSQAADQGSAVLIRALQPVDGISTMVIRRQIDRPINLCRGPARLCEALGIDKAMDGHDLTSGQTLWIDDSGSQAITNKQIKRTPRIGVTSAKHLKLRFVLAGNRFASGPRKMR